MADQTHIEWTDATWNPITGCSVVSAGCKHCYAMKLAGTRLQHHPSRAGLTIEAKAGPVWTGEVRFNAAWLDQPLRWRDPRRIFVCAHGDLFHESVPDAWIDHVFGVMALAPQHTFQVLTKRAARMRAYFADENAWPRIEVAARRIHRDRTGNQIAGKTLIGPLPHIWLGVSVEDQATADARIPLLLQTPAAVRWISAEPLLGPLNLAELGETADFRNALKGLRWRGTFNGTGMRDPWAPDSPSLDWVVVGGESGPGARPMHPAWARTLRHQCEAAGVAFLFKQWGAWIPVSELDDTDHLYHPLRAGQPEDSTRRCTVATTCIQLAGGSVPDNAPNAFGPGAMLAFNVGKKAAGRELDGRLHDEYPRSDR